MSNIWQLGRTGKLFVKAESTYGTAPTLTATDAVRHRSVDLPFSPRNRVWSPERYTDPSHRTRLTRRATGGFDVLASLYPSGTLNTAPESGAILQAGLGATAGNVTLATTLSGTPTTTTGTVASAVGLAIGQWILITIGSGANAGTYARVLTGKATSDLTWAPALPGAPASGDAVKGAITYGLATALPTSLDIAHYNTAKNREQLGCVIDKMVFTFDANEEPTLHISGPAKGYASSPQAQPGTFTTVGAENAIPSGLTGFFYRAGVLYEITKLVVTVTNAMELQNKAYGTASASAFYRKGKRQVDVDVMAMVSDQTALYDAAVATTDQSIMLQCGLTAGGIWGVYLPTVEFEVPTTPDNDETSEWSFKGVAKATAGNDEFVYGAL